MNRRSLDRWPLILVGMVLIGWASVNLADGPTSSETESIVLGLGVFLLGAGTALVILGIGRDGSGHDDDE